MTGFPQHCKHALILLVIMFIAVPAFAQDLPDAFWPETAKETVKRQMSLLAGQSAQVSGQFTRAGNPVRVHGYLENAGFGATQATREAMFSLIDNNVAIFGVVSSDLEVLYDSQVNGKAYMTARQLVDGRPVLGTRVLLRVAQSGKVALWGSDVERQASVSWQGSWTAADAETELAAYSGLAGYTALETREVWVRVDGELLSAWMVALEGESPILRPVGLLNANTGEMLGFYNDAYSVEVNGTVTGPVHYNQINQEPEWLPFRNMAVEMGPNTEVTDEEGYFNFSGLSQGSSYDFRHSLYGPWVDVNYEDGPDASVTLDVVAPGNAGLDWQSPEQGRADEFNIFYHTNFIHDWYKVLDPDFYSLDYPVGATVAFQDNWENAMWSGNQMFFGTGANSLYNLAMFSDVIYHEYTHGVTGAIYPRGTLPYQGQSGALNEAWSDYIPCSIHDYSTMAPGVYVGSPGTPMRNLNNNRSYPDSYVDEVHTDGLIPGGSMWDTRELLGAEITDPLFHYARYGLAEDFEGYFIEVLVQDDDDGDLSNGTPHDWEIYTAFGQHGIGPGAEPNLVIDALNLTDENDDGYLMPGEWVELNMQVWNDVALYPPPAEDVTLQIAGDECTLFETDEVVIGQLAPGESSTLPQPIRFQVANTIEPHYVTLEITLTANDGTYSQTLDHRITLGQPTILLVDDCGATSYLSYVDGYIENLISAAEVIDADHEIPSLETMSDFDVTIWITGDNRNPLNAAEVSVLTNHLDNGGKVVLSGQYIGPQLSDYTDLSFLLGVSESIDSTGARGIQGVNGQPLSDGLMSALVGAGGANNQTAPSGIVPTNMAEALYTYIGSDAVAAVWNETPNEGVAVYMGFGLEAISGISTSAPGEDILYPILNAMGVTLDVEGPENQAVQEMPVTFELEAPYPNPFNPQTHIAYTLPQTSDVSLKVYNLNGREVMTLMQGVRTAGRHEMVVDLSGFASGLYLVKLESSFGTSVQKAWLVK